MGVVLGFAAIKSQKQLLLKYKAGQVHNVIGSNCLPKEPSWRIQLFTAEIECAKRVYKRPDSFTTRVGLQTEV